MGKFYVTPRPVSYPELEERWSFAEGERISEREFARARHRGLARAFAGFCGRAVGGTSSHQPTKGKARLAIDRRGAFKIALGDIAGLVREDGSLTKGLPTLPRKLKEAWKGEYSRVASDTVLDFSLRGGNWYLVGGNKALLRLEILRARGEEAVHAVKDTEAECCGRQDLPCRDLGALSM
jgi:hypothetical protein